MEFVYTGQEPPQFWSQSIFLAGPTPREETGGNSWRPEMIRALREAGYTGVVFIPEYEDGAPRPSYDDQIEWEQKWLNACDLILMWVPREMKTMPAFTTNVEFGTFLHSGKLLYGRPDDAPKNTYLDSLYRTNWGREPKTTVEDMAREATVQLHIAASHAPSPSRSRNERCIPLDVWGSPQFRSWYQRHYYLGNRIEDAKVLWTFYVGPTKRTLFSFAMWVKIWIASEKRYKENEFILSRSDVSMVVAYRSGQDWEATGETKLGGTRVVLVREFRTPARTRTGFIHELPGGSGAPGEDPLDVAVKELEEETGVKVAPSRLRGIRSRQVAGTLSTHHANVYAVELTPKEMAKVSRASFEGETFGVGEDSERTYVDVATVDKILQDSLLDWATVGMIFEAVSA